MAAICYSGPMSVSINEQLLGKKRTGAKFQIDNSSSVFNPLFGIQNLKIFSNYVVRN